MGPSPSATRSGGRASVLLTKAVHELERSDTEHALVTMCCGGGLGTGTRPPARLTGEAEMASAERDLGAPPRQTMESLLMATSRSLRRAYDSRLAGLGLKLSEAYLLGHVHTHGPMTQTQLAEGLGIGRAATGALIDALEGKGLVERSAHAADRRVWLVATTRTGRPAGGRS